MAPQYTPASGEGTISGNYIYKGGRWIPLSQHLMPFKSAFQQPVTIRPIGYTPQPVPQYSPIQGYGATRDGYTFTKDGWIPTGSNQREIGAEEWARHLENVRLRDLQTQKGQEQQKTYSDILRRTTDSSASLTQFKPSSQLFDRSNLLYNPLNMTSFADKLTSLRSPSSPLGDRSLLDKINTSLPSLDVRTADPSASLARYPDKLPAKDYKLRATDTGNVRGAMSLDDPKSQQSIEEAHDITDKAYRGLYDKLGTGSDDWLSDDFFSLVKGEENQLKGEIDRIMNAGWDPDRTIRDMLEAEKNSLRKVYQTLIEKKKGEIPGIRTKTDEMINDLTTALDKFETLGSEKKFEAEDTYGKFIRQAAESSRYSQGKLRNVMSSMGSAESSQFLDRFANIDRQTQDSISTYNRDLMRAVTDIDRTLQERRDLTERERKSLIDRRDELIKEAEHAVDIYGIQEAEELNKLNMQEAQGRAGFEEQMRNFELQRLMQQQEYGQDLGKLLGQGNIDFNLIKETARQNNPEQFIPNSVQPIMSNARYYANGQFTQEGIQALIALAKQDPLAKDYIQQLLQMSIAP